MMSKMDITDGEADCWGAGDEGLAAGGAGIQLNPIGRVECAVKATAERMPGGWRATIRVWPEYTAALHRITDHSHLWILCWFHESRRDLLKIRPCRMDAALPEYGVFGLRSPARRNPISLTTVKLEKAEGNFLHVSGLDAIDGTLVLDIKPYFGSDVIFSARAPYMRPLDRDMRQDMFMKMALGHHGEDCPGLRLGVRMALLAEEHLGCIQDEELKLTVRGSACLADVLQGLTRARLANPPRFAYLGQQEETEVVWMRQGKRARITVRPGGAFYQVFQLTDQDLFAVELS